MKFEPFSLKGLLIIWLLNLIMNTAFYVDTGKWYNAALGVISLVMIVIVSFAINEGRKR